MLVSWMSLLVWNYDPKAGLATGGTDAAGVDGVRFALCKSA
jgi:hypothetical protein